MIQYEKLRKVPDWAKKTIKGGDLAGKTDINPQWRIQAMTEVFGMCGVGWYYIVTNKWLEANGDNVCAFVDIELFVKYEGEWSMPIAGTGGNMFAYPTNKGYMKVSDECWKMATTDALSVAMKQLGVGADVYSGFEDSKYQQDKTDSSASHKNSSQEEKPWLNPTDKKGGMTEEGKAWIALADNEGKEVAVKWAYDNHRVSNAVKSWMDEYKPTPKSNAGTGYNIEILKMLEAGTDKQRETLANMLSSTKFDGIREKVIDIANTPLSVYPIGAATTFIGIPETAGSAEDRWLFSTLINEPQFEELKGKTKVASSEVLKKGIDYLQKNLK